MNWPLALAWLCALVVGYSINQGGTCGVASARALVENGQIDGFAGFAVATGAAGIVCLPAVWALGMGGHASSIATITPALCGGAILLGLGAVLNDACLLGSLWRLGNGELRFLGLPAGLAVGFALAVLVPAGIGPPLQPNPLVTPSLQGVGIVAGSVAILAAALALLRRLPRRKEGAWPLAVAMGVLGVTGAALYVLQPGWSYAETIRRGVSPVMAMVVASNGGAIAAVLTVVGACASAIRLGVFHPSRPSANGLARSFGGGILIAIGALTIPGGNDTLLLAAVPAGSMSGALAYTIMTFVILACVALGRRRRRLRRNLLPANASQLPSPRDATMCRTS